VETGNRSALRQALRTYRPYGETPIGFALQEAAEDLGDEGRRTVVLVSDGEPTCDPDPCEVARDLSE
jgi:Ca-activated chloride channel family protein